MKFREIFACSIENLILCKLNRTFFQFLPNFSTFQSTFNALYIFWKIIEYVKKSAKLSKVCIVQHIYISKSLIHFSKIQKPRFPPDLSLFHTTFWKEKLFRDVLLPYLFIFRHINFFFWRLIKQGFPHKRLEVALCGKI